MKFGLISIGIASATLIGAVIYCIRFDRKRRADPEYRKKVEKRRRVRNRPKNPFEKYNVTLQSTQEQKRAFFFSQMQSGEEMLAYGKIEEAIDYFSNAVIFSTQPESILQFICSRLPVQIAEQLYLVFDIKMKEIKEYDKFIKINECDNKESINCVQVETINEPIVIDVD